MVSFLHKAGLFSMYISSSYRFGVLQIEQFVNEPHIGPLHIQMKLLTFRQEVGVEKVSCY